MQAIVHLTVGLVFALFIFSLIDLQTRHEFILTFGSGFWALIPDFHWLFREFQYYGIASAWKSFHHTIFSNLFWFHRFIDRNETPRTNLEIGAALALLLVAVLTYYVCNDWRT